MKRRKRTSNEKRIAAATRAYTVAGQMAILLYNLKQQEQQTLSFYERQIMADLVKQWDADSGQMRLLIKESPK